MEDERVFKMALKVLSEEEDPLFDMAESIVKVEASSNRVRAREALYEIFPACKEKARRRVLKLLGETRVANPQAALDHSLDYNPLEKRILTALIDFKKSHCFVVGLNEKLNVTMLA